MKNQQLSRGIFIIAVAALAVSAGFALYALFLAPAGTYSPPAVGAGHGYAVSDRSTWRTFGSPELGIEFEYPAEWGEPYLHVGKHGVPGRPDWYVGMASLNRCARGFGCLALDIGVAKMAGNVPARSIANHYSTFDGRLNAGGLPDAPDTIPHCYRQELFARGDVVYSVDYSFSGQDEVSVQEHCEILKEIVDEMWVVGP